MPAFCSLLLPSYYPNDFASKISASQAATNFERSSANVAGKLKACHLHLHMCLMHVAIHTYPALHWTQDILSNKISRMKFRGCKCQVACENHETYIPQVYIAIWSRSGITVHLGSTEYQSVKITYSTTC